MSETRDALLRLKRHMGRERGRHIRFYESATDQHGKDRAYYEINIWALAMGMVDAELKREQGQG